MACRKMTSQPMARNEEAGVRRPAGYAGLTQDIEGRHTAYGDYAAEHSPLCPPPLPRGVWPVFGIHSEPLLYGAFRLLYGRAGRLTTQTAVLGFGQWPRSSRRRRCSASRRWAARARARLCIVVASHYHAFGFIGTALSKKD